MVHWCPGRARVTAWTAKPPRKEVTADGQAPTRPQEAAQGLADQGPEVREARGLGPVRREPAPSGPALAAAAHKAVIAQARSLSTTQLGPTAVTVGPRQGLTAPLGGLSFLVQHPGERPPSCCVATSYCTALWVILTSSRFTTLFISGLIFASEIDVPIISVFFDGFRFFRSDDDAVHHSDGQLFNGFDVPLLVELAHGIHLLRCSDGCC